MKLIYIYIYIYIENRSIYNLNSTVTNIVHYTEFHEKISFIKCNYSECNLQM